MPVLWMSEKKPVIFLPRGAKASGHLRRCRKPYITPLNYLYPKEKSTFTAD